MALHKKFKTKKDLYNYMTHSRKYQTKFKMNDRVLYSEPVVARVRSVSIIISVRYTVRGKTGSQVWSSEDQESWRSLEWLGS